MYKPKYDVWWSRVLGTTACFVAVAFAWIFFRANNVADAFAIIGKIFTNPGKPFFDLMVMLTGGIGLAVLIFKDLKDDLGWKISFMHSSNVVVRYASVVALISYILLFGSFTSGQFIYFQF